MRDSERQSVDDDGEDHQGGNDAEDRKCRQQKPRPHPMVGGYWLAASDGGLFAFGEATFYGSTGGRAIPAPVVTVLVPRQATFALLQRTLGHWS